MATITYPTSGGAEQEPLLASRENEEGGASIPDVEERIRAEHRLGDFTLSVVSYAGLLLFLITTWYLVFSNNPRQLSWFAFHPPLQSLAITLFTLGILTLQPTATPEAKSAGLTRHQAFQLAGLATLALGGLAIIYNKLSHHAAHFTSWHGRFGLLTLILLISQATIGGLSVWYGGKAFGGGAKAKAVYKYHRISGYLIFPLMLLTAHLAGMYSDWTTMVAGPVLRTFGYIVAPLLILTGVWGRARLSKMKFW